MSFYRGACWRRSFGQGNYSSGPALQAVGGILAVGSVGSHGPSAAPVLPLQQKSGQTCLHPFPALSFPSYKTQKAFLEGGQNVSPNGSIDLSSIS